MSEILKIVSDRILIKKQSDHLMAKCPFHSDYIGTLHIDTWNNQAYCPVCNRAWTPTLFISEFDKKPIYEAYSQIAPITIENNEWQKPYKEIKAQVELYKSNYKGSPAEAYMQSRGIDPITAEHFSLGYSSTGFFANRVIFPIKNMYGKYVGFTARTLNGEEPKYKNSKNSPIFQKKRLLYGYDSEFVYDSYILVEGQMDVIKLQSLGYGNAVCSSGTAVNSDQLIGMKKVYICLDQDDAGAKATERTIEIAKGLGIEYEVITFDGAKDPDEFISKGGDIYSKIPMDGDVARRDTNADMNVLAAYSLLDEEEVEKSIIPKNWLKTANDSTLRYYLSILNQSAHRFRIEREMKFRRGGNVPGGIDVDTLKSSVDIQLIVESYGIQIAGRRNIPCPLPGHEDRTPSFSINKSRNLFKCFGCGKGGSQVDLIKEMEQCSDKQAIDKLQTFYE